MWHKPTLKVLPMSVTVGRTELHRVSNSGTPRYIIMYGTRRQEAWNVAAVC